MQQSIQINNYIHVPRKVIVINSKARSDYNQVAILKKHNIGYHIYADDTQLYISFNSKEPLTSLTKLNNYIFAFRVWMIKNKLKLNDSKTEFIIFRSPLLKTELSGVSISVGDSQISSSPKVRDLGVIFDNCLSLDAHI